MITQEQYAKINQDLSDPAVYHNRYSIIDFQVTLRCNNKCLNCIKFCNMDDITGLDFSNSDITMTQVHQFIDDVKIVYRKRNSEENIVFGDNSRERWVAVVVYLTGGEPLLHPNIIEIHKLIKEQLVDTGMIGHCYINSNLKIKAPEVLEPYIINFSPLNEKLEIHAAVLWHPLDNGQTIPTWNTCPHYRKHTVVYNYMGYNMCCAADAYIRLFDLNGLIIKHLPAFRNGFPLDRMDKVCNHCPFGCAKMYREKDVGRPVSLIYSLAGMRNKLKYKQC